MTARYGDRTRVTSQVKTWGKDVDAADVKPKEPFEEIFAAPGTWTYPGNVTEVEVTLVGGGGGGGGNFGAYINAFPNGPSERKLGSGGGGGVRVERVPVNAPVPVVVGAGGLGGINAPPLAPSLTPRAGTTGGDSSFGTVVVGGGGHGANYRDPASPSISIGQAGDAPPIGGGGGGGNQQEPTPFVAQGGAFGFPGGSESYGTNVLLSPVFTANGGSASVPGNVFPRSFGDTFFGTGGVANDAQRQQGGIYSDVGGGRAFLAIPTQFPGTPALALSAATPGLDGTGGGGGGATRSAWAVPNWPSFSSNPLLFQSGDGGAGVVIVRWEE